MAATSESFVPHPLTRPFRTAIQIGVVVRDIERSMAMLTEVFGIGPFRVETHRVGMTVGGIQISLRTGALPGALGTALMMARTTGIISNAVLEDRVVGYLPRRGQLVL